VEIARSAAPAHLGYLFGDRAPPDGFFGACEPLDAFWDDPAAVS
jgi:hypothetical protein